MQTIKITTGYALRVLAIAMLLVGSINLTLGWDVITLPLPYDMFLTVIALILLAAAVAELLLKGGWARIPLGLLFGWAAYNVLSLAIEGTLPAEYVTGQGELLASLLNVLLCCGALQMFDKGEYWLKLNR